MAASSYWLIGAGVVGTLYVGVVLMLWYILVGLTRGGKGWGMTSWPERFKLLGLACFLPFAMIFVCISALIRTLFGR